VEDIPPEELGKEIERLWAKVGSASAQAWEPFSPAAAVEPVTGREVAWETMALLKRQHRHETRYWAEVLEAKERAARGAQERLAFLELEVSRLREKTKSDESRFMVDGLDTHAKAEAALNALQEERARHERELNSLRALLEQTRERMSVEEARVRQERERWDKKEQQHLFELKDLQTLAARRESEVGQSGDKIRGLSDNLKEAKNALEKTLSELLRERQVREESETEREKALKKVDEVQKHFEELSKIWEEERAQWRELWDRERSTWETQRGEFSSWEDKLRKERETWLAEVKAKEQDQAVFSEQISRSLKESSEATSRMSSLMRELSARARGSFWAAAPAWTRWTALAAVVIAAAAFPMWRYRTTLHFKPIISQAVDLANPTSLADDGALLWIAEWNGKLLAFDPRRPDAPVRSVTTAPGGPYRPVAIAFGGGNLWALDAAQARIIRYKADQPDQVLSSRPSPGPAPTALAYDGRSLWSFDAANKALYRHDEDDGSYKSFALGQDVIATAMAWVDGKLWVVDVKTRQLLVFDFKEGRFEFRARYALGDSLIGVASARAVAAGGGRRLWALSGPTADRSGDALIEYGY